MHSKFIVVCDCMKGTSFFTEFFFFFPQRVHHDGALPISLSVEKGKKKKKAQEVRLNFAGL